GWSRLVSGTPSLDSSPVVLTGPDGSERCSLGGWRLGWALPGSIAALQAHGLAEVDPVNGPSGGCGPGRFPARGLGQGREGARVVVERGPSQGHPALRHLQQSVPHRRSVPPYQPDPTLAGVDGGAGAVVGQAQ